MRQRLDEVLRVGSKSVRTSSNSNIRKSPLQGNRDTLSPNKVILISIPINFMQPKNPSSRNLNQITVVVTLFLYVSKHVSIECKIYKDKMKYKLG